MRGAWLHVMTDALGSVQAIVAAGLIWGLWLEPGRPASIGIDCDRLVLDLIRQYRCVEWIRATVGQFAHCRSASSSGLVRRVGDLGPMAAVTSADSLLADGSRQLGEKWRNSHDSRRVRIIQLRKSSSPRSYPPPRAV